MTLNARTGYRRGGVAVLLAAAAAVPWAGGAEAAFPGPSGKIVFMSTRGGDADIWSIGPDGANPVQLTTAPGLDTEPSVSPDGRWIAFTSTRAGDHEVWVMRSDGSDQTRLTASAGFDQQPAWSPDGRRIAFQSTRTGVTQIWVMNADGSGQTQLTDDGWAAGNAAWGPNGQIAFTKNVSGNTDVFTLGQTDRCCSRGTQLTDANGTDTVPNFSPDGGEIAFVSARHGNFEIYRMGSDGSGEVRVTNHASVDNTPAFSPDGTRIVFESRRDDTGGEIYSAALDGSDVTRLTSAEGIDTFPDWATEPDTRPPAAPAFSGIDPGTRANENLPAFHGLAEASSVVRLFTGGSCSGTPAATGPAATFAAPGLRIAVPDDSTTTVRATATDGAGNVSACSDPITYVEDSSPPETTITAGPAGPTNSDRPTFEFSSSEPGSTFACRVDGAPLAPCTSPHSTAPLSDGAHTFEVRGVDAAGNADPTNASRSFRVCTGTTGPAATTTYPLLQPVDAVLADRVAATVCG